MAENCTCDDALGYRTLSELRDAVIAGLGFVAPLADQPTKTLSAMRTEIKARMGIIDPLASAPTRTLLQLRTSVKSRLGFFDPITSPPTKTLAALRTLVMDTLGLADPMANIATRSLEDLREDLLVRMGYSAIAGAGLPPGMETLLDSFINEAQQTLFRRLELDKGDTALPALMSAVSDVTTLDYVPVLNLATALALAHNNKPDAKAYFEITEKYLQDCAKRRPPNIAAAIDARLIEAQQTVYRRWEMAKSGAFTLSAFAVDADSTTLDYKPILLLALAEMKAQVGQSDAKEAMDEFERYMADQIKRGVPGLDTLVNNLLIEAQETVVRRYEWGEDTYDLSAFAADADSTTIDYKPVELLATANAKSYFKQDDAKVYHEQFERYMADVLTRSPPGIDDQINAMLRQAQETVYRQYEFAASGDSALNPLAADDDQTTIDYHPVQLLALAHMKTRGKHEDAKLVMAEYEGYMGTLERQRPANAISFVTNALKDAQRQIIRRYPAVRMDRWFSWTLTEGERFYDFPDNDEQSAAEPCAKLIDTLSIKWIGVTRDETRTELRRGVPPQVLDMTTTGWPSHYEIKQCIELWPAPSATEGTLRIRAGFLASDFTEDTDRPSIDDELVYLFALANCKAFYKQPDAGFAQFEVHLQGVVAGSHGPNRYIPGRSQGGGVYVEPRPTVPLG